MVDNKKSFSKNKQRREKASNVDKMSFVDKHIKNKSLNDRPLDKKKKDFSKDKNHYSESKIQKQEQPKIKISNPHSLLYGTHAVNAALENPNRILKILYVTPNKQSAYEHYGDRVKVRSVSADEMDNLVPFGAVHQGVALASILQDVSETEDYTKTLKPIIVLDGLSDPQNIGAILRTSAAFGVEHLIMQDKGSPDITGAMAKAAAGAIEKVRIHKVTNLSRVLEELKDNNFMIYGADGQSETSISDVKFSPKSVIVMGAEGDGMRRLIKQNCDVIIKIPIESSVESLNVSNAFAIILYAVTVSKSVEI
jgi:23S rRNA (guanosine2251-2'-O)-methyltransferase